MENKPDNRDSKVVLAWVLIGLGIFWMLRKLGFYFELPDFYYQIFYPVKHAFQSLFGFIFSWPMILIIVGLLLMAGRRSGGLVLIVIGGLFLLPRIFVLTGLTFSMFFPVLLIALGIAMIARKV